MLVHATGEKIGSINKQWCTTHLGAQWREAVVNGKVVAKVAAPSGSKGARGKWQVKFTHAGVDVNVEMTAHGLKEGHFDLELGAGAASGAAGGGASTDAGVDVDSDLEQDAENEMNEEEDEMPEASDASDKDEDEDDDGFVHLEDKKKTWSVDWKKDADCSADERESRGATRFGPEMIWRETETGRGVDDFFFHFFLPEAGELTKVAVLSNDSRDTHGKTKRPISEHEIVKTLGYLLAMTCNNTSVKRELFRAEHDPGGEERLFPAPAFGERYGMSRDRFEFVLRWLRFGADDPNDKWAPVRSLIASFNDARYNGYKPGWRLCLDESVSAWRGKNGEIQNGGMPHVVKIIRKPKGVGCELVDIADTDSGVILRLEIKEGKAAEAKKLHAAEHGHGTGVTLRLTTPWHSSGRVVVADSAFGSVKTAVQMRKSGMHFIGMVKTAHMKYPKKYFDAMERQPGVLERGNTRSLTATVDGVPLAAHCWFDNTPKQLIATCGSSVDGPPHEKKRWRNEDDGSSTTYKKAVKRSKVVADYFGGAATIDIDNHYRQGGLALEGAWGTHNWSHRVAATVIGMCEVDAFLAWSRSVQETTSLFALLWRARMTRHAHAASHVPSDTAGEHDTPTPVLVRPRGHTRSLVRQPFSFHDRNTLFCSWKLVETSFGGWEEALSEWRRCFARRRPGRWLRPRRPILPRTVSLTPRAGTSAFSIS